jgi:hypothetical protein
VDDAAYLRQQAMNKLRVAVTFATAGELHRAAEFLDFAREIRSGKTRLRRGARSRARQRAIEHHGYYADEA